MSSILKQLRYGIDILTILTLMALIINLILIIGPQAPIRILRGFLGFLTFIGIRQKGQPFGYVYDAVTKEPIVRALVRIFDGDGKLLRTDVTDYQGVFTLHLGEGTFLLKVYKPGYNFPTKIVVGNVDGDIKNIYRGGEIESEEGDEVNYAVPIDPVKAGIFIKVYVYLKGRTVVLFRLLLLVLFVMGIILSAIITILDPSRINLLILLIYLVGLVVTWFSERAVEARYGTITYLDGLPVADLKLSLVKGQFQTFVDRRITDSAGRYRFIIDEGEYALVINNERIMPVNQADAQFKVKGKKGVINRDIKVKRIARSN